MKAYRVVKVKIKEGVQGYEELDKLSHLTNNLHNHSYYIFRQAWIEKPDSPSVFIDRVTMDKYLRDIQEENYIQLPAQTAQQCLRVLYESIKSFIKLVKDYGKHPEKYKGRPRLPRYRRKMGMNNVNFTGQQVRLNSNTITFPKVMKGLTITLNNCQIDKVREVRFLPMQKYFIAEIVYEVELEQLSLDKSRIAGIDLGLNNFATISTNDGKLQPIILDGKGLKSRNKYFNDKVANLQSLLPKNQHNSKNLQRLWNKRSNIMKNMLHQYSRFIVNYCLENNIGTIVIGHNKKQKDGLKMKNFVQVPIFSIISYLKYKCEPIGIELIEVNEQYTSGTSCLDNELPNKTFYNNNRRRHRGLFISNNGIKINADVNSSQQIIKRWNENYLTPKQNKLLQPVKLTLL